MNAPRLAMAMSTLPNRAAKVVVLPWTKSVNWANVMLASCAAFLMFITDFPKRINNIGRPSVNKTPVKAEQTFANGQLPDATFTTAQNDQIGIDLEVINFTYI